MGKLLDYIAKETQGECFASFKYCYDNMLPPNIEYEAKEDSYINMKEFAESIHDPQRFFQLSVDRFPFPAVAER